MQQKQHWFQQIRLEYLWGMIILAGIFSFMNLRHIVPNDFWFHLAYGRSLVSTGVIPLYDTFSFTQPGQPYESIYTYWLGQGFIYILYHVGGVEWAMLIFSLIVTTAYGILFAVNLDGTKNWRAAALGLLFTVTLGITNWNIRPQLFAYLLAAISIWAIYQYRLGHKPWLWGGVLALVMAGWVNTHGTFFIPFALAGILFLEDLVRGWQTRNWRLLVPVMRLLGLLALGSLCNPHGYKIVEYAYGMSKSNQVQQYVVEWQPSSIYQPDGVIFFLVFGLFVLIWVLSRYRPSISESISFIFFAFLAFRYERGVVWFGITQSLLFAAMVARLFLKVQSKAGQNEKNPENYHFNRLLFILILVMMGCSLPWLRTYFPIPADEKSAYMNTPITAVETMQKSIPVGNVFSDMAFSGYVSWETNSEYKTFVDPRVEFFPFKIWTDYLDISTAKPGWNEKLLAYKVNILLLSPETQQPLVLALLGSKTWHKVYEDKIAVLYVPDK